MSNEFGETINGITGTITTTVSETKDQFIFKTISDFASRDYEVVIEKEELISAINYIRFCKEHNLDVVQSVNESISDFESGYRLGYEGGKIAEHKRVMEIIDVMMNQVKKEV